MGIIFLLFTFYFLNSPELQPAERLWPVTNQAMPSAGYAYANESFDSLDHLEEALFQRMLCDI